MSELHCTCCLSAALGLPTNTIHRCLTRAPLFAARLCASVYGIEEKRYLVLLAHMLGAQFTSNMRAVNTHLLVRPRMHKIPDLLSSTLTATFCN